MSNLLNVLSSVTRVPANEQQKLMKISSSQTLRKNELFIRIGQVPSKFAFVESGLFRYFYVDRKGNEFTKGFFPEGSFITAYSGMLKGTGSFYAIEALEDAHLTVIDYARWKNLYDGHECWKLFLIALLEKGYLKKEARERELLQCNAEERYQTFLRDFPSLEHRLRQHHVASYLGITPVALSRTRKKIGLLT